MLQGRGGQGSAGAPGFKVRHLQLRKYFLGFRECVVAVAGLKGRRAAFAALESLLGFRGPVVMVEGLNGRY